MTAGQYTALDASVLVLNKMFMAVHVICVRRAFCLLCKDLAEVVTLEDGQFATYDFSSWAEVSAFKAKLFKQEDDDWVRTPTAEIQAPRVIRLLAYDKVPKQTVKFNRRNIFARDNNQCQYCGKKFPTSGAEPGPRHPAQPGRGDHLGEHRLRLRGLQRPQGRPDPAAGEHDADPQAGEAEAQPGAEPEADPEEVPVLAVVPRQRLLVGRAEVTVSRRVARR